MKSEMICERLQRATAIFVTTAPPFATRHNRRFPNI
jgi:hypothetical protein